MNELRDQMFLKVVGPVKRFTLSDVLFGFFLSVVVLACSNSNLIAQSTYQEIEVQDGGTIFGTVRFKGDVSRLEKLEITKNPDHCGTIKNSPCVQVGENRGVKHTFVYLEGITQGKKLARGTKYVLDQENCEYVPHAMILPLGTRLEITNSDAILHNVHAYYDEKVRRSIFNIAQPVKGQRTPIKKTLFKKAGFIVATCDAGHPWMTAHILVTEHPYVALTEENGSFLLDDVPPGSYKIKMWHEGMLIIKKEMEGDKVKKYYREAPYELVKEIVVPANGEVSVDFELVLR